MNEETKVEAKAIERLAYTINEFAEAARLKDADRLAGDGLVATTNPGGAGKFNRAYAPALEGRRVPRWATARSIRSRNTRRWSLSGPFVSP